MKKTTVYCALFAISALASGTASQVVASQPGARSMTRVTYGPPVGFGSPKQVAQLSSPAPDDGLVADFDGDGQLDVAVLQAGDILNGDPGALDILLGLGGGLFNEAGSIGLFGGAGGLRSADFNGDGILDLTLSSSPEIEVLLGDGKGGFKISTSIGIASVTGNPMSQAGFVAPGDFDEDGLVDLVFYQSFPFSRGYFAHGNGDGTFAAATSPPGITNAGGGGIFAADFNNDGHLDLGGNKVMLGDGTGDFASVPGSFASAAEDLNGDGILDSINFTISSVLLSPGTGTGTFDTFNSVTLTAPSNIAFGARIADVNGDGKKDVLLTGGSQVFVFAGFSGQGGFNFTPAQSFPSGGPLSSALATGDWNGDGLDDFLVAHANPQSTPFVTASLAQ